MPTIKRGIPFHDLSGVRLLAQKKRITGVGPASLAWEARVLPMYYIREPLHYNFFPSKKQRDFQKALANFQKALANISL